MNVLWGILLTSITLKCWVGQIIIALSPKIAAKIRIIESQSDMDPTFFTDIRSQAMWDIITLWTLPAAGVLLILNNNLWTYFGLIGGGMYLYFTGRGITTRWTMQHQGIHIGKSNLKANLFLSLWCIVASITIIIAIIELTP